MRTATESHPAFQAETGNNFYREIPLSEILAVETVRSRTDLQTEHCFEIRTANLDYFVGSAEDDEDGLASWEAAIRQSLKPAGASGFPGVAGAAGAAGAVGAVGGVGGVGGVGAEDCAETSLDTQVIVILS